MKSKIMLALAIVMSLVTMYLFFHYMQQFDAAASANDTLVEVVAAKQDIQENQRLTAGMVETVKVPQLGLHPGAVRSATDIEGKFATAAIVKGEVLLDTRIQQEKDETVFVSRKVRDGYRAVSVGVNFVQSVSNLIEPEDLVDVIFTPADKGTGPVVSSILLEHVRVLAIGRRMAEATAETPYAEYSAVTLEVRPQDAVNVVNADERGTVSLALHSKLNREAGAK